MDTSKESSNQIFFSEKTYFTSYVRNMFWANISYKYHNFMSLVLKIVADIKSHMLLPQGPAFTKNTISKQIAQKTAERSVFYQG